MSKKYSVNGAKKQGERTVAPEGINQLQVNVRPGGCGDDELLRPAKKDITTLMLEMELIFCGVEYDSFRIFPIVAVDYGTTPSRQQKRQIEGGMSVLKAILESHLGIHPDDQSNEAVAKREYDSFLEFDYLTFWAKVGVTTSEKWGDQNDLFRILVPGDADYPGPLSGPQNPTQPAPTPSGPQSPSGGTVALPAPTPSASDLDDDYIPFMAEWR